AGGGGVVRAMPLSRKRPPRRFYARARKRGCGHEHGSEPDLLFSADTPHRGQKMEKYLHRGEMSPRLHQVPPFLWRTIDTSDERRLLFPSAPRPLWELQASRRAPHSGGGR